MLRPILPLALLSVVALSGCPNNTVPDVYSIADWHVRCATGMSCTPPEPRMVTGFNGMTGNTVTCTVTETATDRLVSFTTGSAAGGTRYSVALSGARVPRSGGFPGTGCQVTVTEGANTYRGLCGSVAPTTSQPCQVQLSFDVDMPTGSPRVTAEILCDFLPNSADPTSLRSVHRGAGSPDPGHFEFFDCRGLSASM